jgi:hypothetical protein
MLITMASLNRRDWLGRSFPGRIFIVRGTQYIVRGRQYLVLLIATFLFAHALQDREPTQFDDDVHIKGLRIDLDDTQVDGIRRGHTMHDVRSGVGAIASFG